MFALQDANGQTIEAALTLFKAPGGHTARLTVLGQQLPPLIHEQPDGGTIETSGGREVLLMIGGGNALDEAGQAFEDALEAALQQLLSAKGI